MRNTALTYSNLAEAALYFDYVVPIGIFFDYAFRAARVSDPSLVETAGASRELVLGLLPPTLRDNQAFLYEMSHLYRSGSETFIQWIEKVTKKLITAPELTGFESWLENAKGVTARFNLSECPVITHPDVLPQAMCDETVAPDFATTMTFVHLVDADKLTWEQIGEFRKDSASRNKLRRLRLFFFAQNYVGKSHQYVEDDLYCLLDDYARVVQSWGFETRAQVIAMLLSSKWVAGALGGSAFSALAGAPVAALVTAAGGFTIEVGHIVLELAKRRHALRKLTHESPISYVADLQSATQVQA